MVLTLKRSASCLCVHPHVQGADESQSGVTMEDLIAVLRKQVKATRSVQVIWNLVLHTCAPFS